MSEVGGAPLEFEYAGLDPKTKDLAYFVNSSEDIDSEGYLQWMPVAAAEKAGASSVTVFPAGLYGIGNAEKASDMLDKASDCPKNDIDKARAIEDYSFDTELDVYASPVEGLMEKEAYWQAVTQAANENTPEELRDEIGSVIDASEDWFGKSVEANDVLETLSCDVPEETMDATQDYTGRDLYTLLQVGESAAALEEGRDAVLGISSEKIYNGVAQRSLGQDFSALRTKQPVNLDGNIDIPYRDDSDKRVQIGDSPWEVKDKLDGAAPEAVRQVRATASEIGDEEFEKAAEEAKIL